MTTQRIYITFGGSHRQNKRCIEALKGFQLSSPSPVGLGSKRLRAIVEDSPEMRAALARVKGAVARNQPAWLNREVTL